ncbi:hypothetical protein [Engelhardtia mirabilis]
MNDPHVELFGAPARSISLAVLAGSAALFLGACGGGSSSGSSATKDMQILEVSNGFGLMLPHRVLKLENGVPSQQVLAIRSIGDLMANVTPTNPVMPVTAWDENPVLPTGAPGNHFIYARFTQPIDLNSVFAPGSAITSDLSGSVSIVATDPATATSQSISVRAFVGGITADTGAGDGSLSFVKWVGKDAGKPVALDVEGEQPGFGFPGTDGSFPGDVDLVRADTLVIVADSDDDLSTYETFPAGLQIALTLGVGVRSTTGNALQATGVGVASGTVGIDQIRPEVGIDLSGAGSFPQITPGGGAIEVDPQTSIKIKLTEAIQPTTLGPLDNGQPAGVGSAVLVTFGPDASKTTVPFTVRPFSPFDLTTFELIPGFSFPGTGPTIASCGTFSRVDISITTQQIGDLTANVNAQAANTFFETGQGPGLINAPVAPDVVYIGRTGSVPGISVIDLNGFGGGTGNPTYDEFNPIVLGNSNFPNNPNVKTQGNLLLPPLQPGTCTFNGGSQGVFTLALDSSLNDKLIRPPLIDSVGDMAIGQPLDVNFNNGPPPFGCQAGFPNVCASSGLKQPTPVVGNFGLSPSQPGQFSSVPPGAGNLIAWAPHPNPPPLIFPPPCISPFIGGQEPTSVEVTGSGALGLTLSNLLPPLGDPFGNPANGIPPSGLLGTEQNAFFVGPSLPAASVSSCSAYQIRQQVGHFLYMIDRVSSEVVVINSNRFTVIDRISLPDPTSMAMSPNADLLAVTNRTANIVSLIDIDPKSSATFHKVVASIPVGKGPSGIAWQPDNEDILVCNELGNSVSVINTFSLQVRKTLNTSLSSPFEVCIGQRQIPGISMSRGVYFAFILMRNNRVAVYESGPDGINGIGADNVVGQVPLEFNAPKGIFIDTPLLTDGFYVLHEGKLDPVTGQVVGSGGALTQINLEGAIGILPLVTSQTAVTVQSRDLEFKVRASVGAGGSGGMTGVPVDLAFDNMVNLGGTAGLTTTFSPGIVTPVNSKSVVSLVGGGPRRSVSPRFVFLAIPNSSEGTGAVDVLEIGSGLQRFDVNAFEPGTQSIRASGATFLCDYWRQ